LANKNKECILIDGKSVNFIQSAVLDMSVEKIPSLTINVYPQFCKVEGDVELYLIVGDRKFKVVEEKLRGEQ
jgi:hypothetical protein